MSWFNLITMLPLLYSLPAMILFGVLKLLRLFKHIDPELARHLSLEYYERWLDLAFVGTLPSNVVLWPRQEKARRYVLSAALALSTYVLIVPARLILIE